MSEGDRGFLCDVQHSSSPAIKNISYNASTARLEGYDGSHSDTLRLERILREAGESFRQLVLKMLSPYAQHLQTDLMSFRAIEEQQRALPTKSRNDLIHID